MSSKGRVPAITARSIVVVASAIVALICAEAPAGAVARASHKGSSASPYPAAAQSPRRLVRPGEYAHDSANGVGGVSSGSSAPASAPSNRAPSKASRTMMRSRDSGLPGIGDYAAQANGAK